MLNLREYQSRFKALISNEFDAGHEAVMGVAPTGFGKTAVIADMARGGVAIGNTVFMVVHRKELIRQTSKSFRKYGIPHGVIASGYPEQNFPIQICSVQTLAKRMHRFFPPDVMIFDEAHHIVSKQFDTVFQWARRSLKLGVTATPVRLDGKGFRDYFSSMVLGDDVSTLINNGWLSRPIFYAPPIEGIDMSGVEKVGGDFNRKQTNLIMDKPHIYGSAVEHYIRLLPDYPPSIAFTSSVDGAENLAREFMAHGVGAASIDGSMSDDERISILMRLADGIISVVISCDLISEGFDLSAACGRDIAIAAAIMLRPTMSESLYIQQGGRALRPGEGKDKTLILDHVNNWQRHGLITDVRDWSLDGRDKKKNGKRGDTLTICKKCFQTYPAQPRCPSCGYQAPAAERKELEVVKDGVLVELNDSMRFGTEFEKKPRKSPLTIRKLERA